MNLLVTNTRNGQAYAIIRALRPHAQKMVVTFEGQSRVAARLSHAANSRLVDRRYYTPSPVEDWRAGRIQTENTEKEEAYVQAVERVCETEKIDTIFPSFDPHVYVFSKNKQRFERMGIFIPVPDYETVLTPLDKYRTSQAAQAVGFPCPRTYLAKRKADLTSIAAELGFPLVLKRRFTSAGRGMQVVTRFSDLLGNWREEAASPLMVQEYIPGNQKQHFCLMLDRQGQLKAAFCPKIHRYFFRIPLSFPTAYESSSDHAYLPQVTRLLGTFGWWGGTLVETKIDARDGIPKLMEINPRIGYPLALGVNEPLLALRLARCEDIGDIERYPTGELLVSLVEDLLGVGFKLLDTVAYRIRVDVQRRAPVDPFSSPLTVREIAKSYSQTYLNGRKIILDQYCRCFFEDPVVSVLWWLQFVTLTVRAAKFLGR